MDIEVLGDFFGNCIIFKSQIGEVSIWHGENPDVDYDSGRSIGEGTSHDIRLAIALTKEAMARYEEIAGKNCVFSYSSDNRDGHGLRRERLFNKIFPEMINSGLYQ